MIQQINTALLCLVLGAFVTTSAQAAPATKKTAASKPAKKGTDEVQAAADAAAAPVATQTDVIGSKEAPGVFNIVPWKDKGIEIPKKEVNTSILRETLQPLDRDVLRREIQLQQTLGRE